CRNYRELGRPRARQIQLAVPGDTGQRVALAPPRLSTHWVSLPCRPCTADSAEGVGFEPTRHFCPLVFKTSSIGRSDSPPVKVHARVILAAPGCGCAEHRHERG